jgi:hypothetical protein
MSILTILGTFLGGRVKDVVGGATANGNTLKKLEDRIIVLEGQAGNPLFVISGQVTGDIQNGIAVELRDDASNTLLQTVTTNGTGNYAFSGRIAGTYKIIPVLNGYTFTPATPVIALSGATTQDFTSSAAAGIPKAANLVAWWNLDEASGTRVNSVNPGIMDLTAEGDASATAGKIGNGVTNLGGNYNNGALTTPHNAALSWNQDCSFLMWVNFGTIAIGQVITSFYQKGNGIFSAYDVSIRPYSTNLVNQRIDSMIIEVQTSDGNAQCIVTVPTGSFPVGVWKQIICTHNQNAKRLRFYLDGVQIETDFIYTGTVVDNSYPVKLGWSHFGITEANKVVDEVAFFNVELDAADVIAHFNGGAGLTP